MFLVLYIFLDLSTFHIRLSLKRLQPAESLFPHGQWTFVSTFIFFSMYTSSSSLVNTPYPSFVSSQDFTLTIRFRGRFHSPAIQRGRVAPWCAAQSFRAPVCNVARTPCISGAFAANTDEGWELAEKKHLHIWTFGSRLCTLSIFSTL